jgi:hypothetical protein
MTRVPVKPRKFIHVLVGCLLLLGLAAACERPATRTNWSPITDAENTATAESLPTALAAEPEAVETGDVEVTPQAIGTLDVSSLPEQFPHSMKGYELFSWQVDGEWYFTLITGTNRMKSFEEIITPGNTVSDDGFIKVSARGIDQLQIMFALLPSGEDVVWSGMDLGGQVPTDTIYLTLPSDEMIEEVKAFCTTLGIHLTAIKPQ